MVLQATKEVIEIPNSTRVWMASEFAFVNSIAYYNFPKARRAIGHLVTACTQNHITKRLRSHVFVKCSYFKLGRSDTSVGDLRKRYGLSPPSDLRVCVLEMSFASYSYVWFKTE